MKVEQINHGCETTKIKRVFSLNKVFEYILHIFNQVNLILLTYDFVGPMVLYYAIINKTGSKIYKAMGPTSAHFQMSI